MYLQEDNKPLLMYRAINYYVDPSTGKEFWDYTKAYTDLGTAKAQATRKRKKILHWDYDRVTRQYMTEAHFVRTWTEGVSAVWQTI